MRIILIIFGISLTFFLIIGLGMSYFITPYPVVAKTFFVSLAKKDYKDAYAMFSKKFKKNLNFKQFQEFMENSEYKNYKEGQWFNIVEGKNEGTMEGIITLKSGKKIALDFSFVSEPDPQWTHLLPDVVKTFTGELILWKIDEIRNH